MGFLLGGAKKEDVPCQFCGKKDGDGRLCWACSFPPLLHMRELDRSKWPCCLLWHGWLPGLSSCDWRISWAVSFCQLACLELERCLGAYLVDNSGHWTPPDYWDAEDIALEMSDSILIFGLMVAGRTFLRLVTLK